VDGAYYHSVKGVVDASRAWAFERSQNIDALCVDCRSLYTATRNFVDGVASHEAPTRPAAGEAPRADQWSREFGALSVALNDAHKMASIGAFVYHNGDMLHHARHLIHAKALSVANPDDVSLWNMCRRVDVASNADAVGDPPVPLEEAPAPGPPLGLPDCEGLEDPEALEDLEVEAARDQLGHANPFHHGVEAEEQVVGAMDVDERPVARGCSAIVNPVPSDRAGELSVQQLIAPPSEVARFAGLRRALLGVIHGMGDLRVGRQTPAATETRNMRFYLATAQLHVTGTAEYDARHAVPLIRPQHQSVQFPGDQRMYSYTPDQAATETRIVIEARTCMLCQASAPSWAGVASDSKASCMRCTLKPTLPDDPRCCVFQHVDSDGNITTCPLQRSIDGQSSRWAFNVGSFDVLGLNEYDLLLMAQRQQRYDPSGALSAKSTCIINAAVSSHWDAPKALAEVGMAHAGASMIRTTDGPSQTRCMKGDPTTQLWQPEVSSSAQEQKVKSFDVDVTAKSVCPKLAAEVANSKFYVRKQRWAYTWHAAYVNGQAFQNLLKTSPPPKGGGSKGGPTAAEDAESRRVDEQKEWVLANVPELTAAMSFVPGETAKPAQLLLIVERYDKLRGQSPATAPMRREQTQCAYEKLSTQHAVLQRALRISDSALSKAISRHAARGIDSMEANIVGEMWKMSRVLNHDHTMTMINPEWRVMLQPAGRTAAPPKLFDATNGGSLVDGQLRHMHTSAVNVTPFDVVDDDGTRRTFLDVTDPAHFPMDTLRALGPFLAGDQFVTTCPHTKKKVVRDILKMQLSEGAWTREQVLGLERWIVRFPSNMREGVRNLLKCQTCVHYGAGGFLDYVGCLARGIYGVTGQAAVVLPLGPVDEHGEYSPNTCKSMIRHMHAAIYGKGTGSASTFFTEVSGRTLCTVKNPRGVDDANPSAMDLFARREICMDEFPNDAEIDEMLLKIWAPCGPRQLHAGRQLFGNITRFYLSLGCVWALFNARPRGFAKDAVVKRSKVIEKNAVCMSNNDFLLFHSVDDAKTIDINDYEIPNKSRPTFLVCPKDRVVPTNALYDIGSHSADSSGRLKAQFAEQCELLAIFALAFGRVVVDRLGGTFPASCPVNKAALDNLQRPGMMLQNLSKAVGDAVDEPVAKLFLECCGARPCALDKQGRVEGVVGADKALRVLRTVLRENKRADEALTKRLEDLAQELAPQGKKSVSVDQRLKYILHMGTSKIKQESSKKHDHSFVVVQCPDLDAGTRWERAGRVLLNGVVDGTGYTMGES